MRSIAVLGILGLTAIAACSSNTDSGDGDAFGSSGSSSAGHSSGHHSGSASGSSSGAGDDESSSGSDSSGSTSSSGSDDSSGSTSGSGSSGSGDDAGPGDDGPSDASSSGASDATGSTSGTSSGGPSDATTGGGGGSSPSTQYLPKISGTCPTIATGTLTFAGEPVQIWAGKPSASQHGPLVLFWYETGGTSSDATRQFGTAQINAVTAQGGIVASFAKSNGQGTNTGDAVWYTGDFDTADQVVACAIDQFHIDTRRIFTTGASAGALQATWMSYARSGYIAAAATLSGGLTGVGAFSADPAPQDSTNIPAAMAVHGKTGVDVVVLDFAVASAAWEADVAKRGGFSIDCNTGGGHVSGPPQICPAIWQFFQDHPFKVSPQPYPPLPSVFPSYCQIGPRAADGGAP